MIGWGYVSVKESAPGDRAFSKLGYSTFGLRHVVPAKVGTQSNGTAEVAITSTLQRPFPGDETPQEGREASGPAPWQRLPA